MLSPTKSALLLGVGVLGRLACASDVFAHFMVSNTYAYSQTEWKADIVAAQQIGIDAFALNWAPPDCSGPQNNQDWNVQRIEDAWTVAAAQDFKLIYSFDMSYTPSGCTSGKPWNTTFMASMISKYASNPAVYKWGDDILVSTYAGEGYGNAFFKSLKDTLAAEGIHIVLAPALTSYTSGADHAGVNDNAVAQEILANYTSIDGFFNWQAWPSDTDTNLTATVDLDIQAAFRAARRGGPYIMAVSPWQFKDLNDGGYNSWVEYSDVLFPHRWEEAINIVQPDIIEIITWNDFPESHYIRDLPPKTGPASDDFGVTAAYIYGHDHSAWRAMAQYYISWFKTGEMPTVTTDHTVFWYRIHPKNVPCTSGTNNVGTVRNSDFPDDAVFAWALVSKDSNVSMSVGSNTNWQFQAKAGCPTLGMIPFPKGVDHAVPELAILRDGAVIAAANGSVPITQACAYEDYNPVVGLVGPAITASPKYGNDSGRKWRRRKSRGRSHACSE